MRHLFRVALLMAALAVAVVSVGAETIAAQQSVTIKGRVVNGTEGASLPPELTVLLLATDQSGGSPSTHSAATDGSGYFQFDGVPLLENGRYNLRVDYGGVSYRETLESDGVSEAIELTVYETTGDVSVVEVRRQVMVISGVNEKDREVAAIEFVRLSNQSDRTLLPDLDNPARMSFLRFSLPPQATDLGVQSDLRGGDVIPVGTGFAVTAPITPGDHGIDFSFRFPYRGDSISYRQSLLQGAAVYQVLVPERLSQLQVAPLEARPPVNLGGTVYRVWEGRDYLPGQGPALELSGLPQPGLITRLGRAVADGTFWQVSIPAIVGATLAVLLLYGLFRAQRPAPALSAVEGPAPPVSGTGQRDGNPARRDALVRAVAALDERFQQGQVAEPEYQAQRERLKARILEASAPPPCCPPLLRGDHPHARGGEPPRTGARACAPTLSPRTWGCTAP